MTGQNVPGQNVPLQNVPGQNVSGLKTTRVMVMVRFKGLGLRSGFSVKVIVRLRVGVIMPW